MKQKYAILPALSMALLLTGCGNNRNNDNDRAVRVTDDNRPAETVRATEPRRDNHNNRNRDDNIVDDAGDVVDDVIDGGRDVVDDVADAGKDVVDDIADAGGDMVDDAKNNNMSDRNR